MAQEKSRSVLFVTRSCDPSFSESLRSFGAVLDQNQDALDPTPGFLRRLGMFSGNRCLELAALDENDRLNLEYARTLLSALSKAGIQPSQIGLLISCRGEEPYALQASDSNYGYGSVFVFDGYSLAARLFMKEVPPCSCIHFRSDGSAAEDYHIVLAGFGRMGRAFLEFAIMNGQFAGSRFRADIFDPNPQNGFLHDHILMNQYDIRFHRFGVTSEEFYAFLEENRDTIRAIYLCTGDPGVNQETASDLTDWYRTSERSPLLVQASPGSISWQEGAGSEPISKSVYSPDVLNLSEMDAMAMQIHAYYSSGSENLEDSWNRCSSFSRMSSRASADFYPAVLKASGKTEEDVLSGSWPPDRDVLENLAVTEHLRWCAFHYVMGYRPMPEEVYEQRIRVYQQEKAETGHPSIQIGKDPVLRLHACLIPWESLDALSARENAVTGGQADYKDTDRRTVLAVRDVLLALHRNRDETSNA